MFHSVFSNKTGIPEKNRVETRFTFFFMESEYVDLNTAAENMASVVSEYKKHYKAMFCCRVIRALDKWSHCEDSVITPFQELPSLIKKAFEESYDSHLNEGNFKN